MVVGQPRLRMIAVQVFEGVLVMAATTSSGTGVPKVYRVTQGLKAENFYLVDKYGGQGQNRTADTGIFRRNLANIFYYYSTTYGTCPNKCAVQLVFNCIQPQFNVSQLCHIKKDGGRHRKKKCTGSLRGITCQEETD